MGKHRAVLLTVAEARAIHFAAGDLAADPDALVGLMPLAGTRAAFHRAMEKVGAVAYRPERKGRKRS